jgi:DNA-binding NtrC family response regulator
MNDKFNIMVVEDDAIAAKVIDFELKSKGYDVRCFENAEEALLYFTQNSIDLVLVDYTLPGMNGEVFYKKILELNPLTSVIFMTALHSVEKAVQLLKLGAFSYLTKPLNIDDLHINIRNALEQITFEKESRLLKEKMATSASIDLPLSHDYVFSSPQMQKILRLAARVAASNSNVLITGESGTGKDVIAQIIHNCSMRKNQSLVKVNLSALPPTLIEAELFGSLKGAYTGASTDRPGKFEEADKGTLFLDEIGELSPDIQVKLLRVIQDREVTRLGSNKPIKLDIHLITATNRNLQDSIKEKTFREDLYYRLNVIDIHIPPLRERKEDIPQLIDIFIDKFNKREGKQINGVSRESVELLMKYPFPGNIRELENIIERALVLTERDIICSEDLPVFILSNEHFDPEILAGDSSLSLAERLTTVEKNILEQTLKKHKYHQTNAAQELGISEGCLRYKIRGLGLGKEKS